MIECNGWIWELPKEGELVPDHPPIPVRVDPGSVVLSFDDDDGSTPDA